MRYRLKKQESGFALLLALIISSVVLAIGVSILHISVNQINLSATARESEFAFQAAHAGVDCQWYWRNEKASEYVHTVLQANPTINCFGTSPIFGAASRFPSSLYTGTGSVDGFFNTFQWGDPSRCTNLEMYVINANSTTDVSVTFDNRGVGDNGVKTCKAGNVCTVIISDGHNRACDEVESSIFSVQREITVEF